MQPNKKEDVIWFVKAILEERKKLANQGRFPQTIKQNQDDSSQIEVNDDISNIRAIVNQYILVSSGNIIKGREFEYIKKILKELDIWEDIPDSKANGRGRKKLHFKLKLKFSDPIKVLEWLNNLLAEHPPSKRAQQVPIEVLERQGDLAAIVQWVRGQAQERIKKKYGTLRLYGIGTPVAINSIYVTVRRWKGIVSQQHISFSDLWSQFYSQNPSNNQVLSLDRFGLSSLKLGAVADIEEILERYDRLMILGNAGVGKTVLLKHIVYQCICGEFLADYVPIFLSLPLLVEKLQSEPNYFALLNFIHESLAEDIQYSDLIERLLHQGKFLLCFDGIDEVPAAHELVVNRCLQLFVERYPSNRYILTCRVAALGSKYLFSSEQFHEIELADFDPTQIAAYITNWSSLKLSTREAVNSTAIRLIELIQSTEYRPIAEIFTSPLLLNLICFIFERNQGRLPKNRSELFREGFELLLKDWDIFRDVRRDEILPNFSLSLSDKKDLFCQIAIKTFEQEHIVFKQEELEALISKFLSDKFNIHDAVLLETYSEIVVAGIALQHGLWIEQFHHCYSFCHLSFHEYLCAYTIWRYEKWNQLAPHLGEYRWQEVFLICAEISSEQTIDAMLTAMLQQFKIEFTNSELRPLLEWCMNESQLNNQSNYNLIAIRAFYYSFLCSNNIDSIIRFTRNRALATSLEDTYVFSRVLGLDQQLLSDLQTFARLQQALELICEQVQKTDDPVLREFRLYRFETKTPQQWLRILLPQYSRLKTELVQYPKLVELASNSSYNPSLCTEWWQQQGRGWAEQLLEDLDCPFALQAASLPTPTNSQKALAQRYYNACFTIISCLQVAPNASAGVKTRLEEALFSPID